MKITFKNRQGSTFHEDLHIFIPELGIDGYSDTYYFADDNGILPGEMSEAKVKIVLKNLLIDWEYAVENLKDNCTTYLPFDFSDQSIEALKVQRKKDQVLISQAWTLATGGMSPSFMNKINFNDREFNVCDRSMTIPIEQFLSEIRRERDRIS